MYLAMEMTATKGKIVTEIVTCGIETGWTGCLNTF